MTRMGLIAMALAGGAALLGAVSCSWGRGPRELRDRRLKERVDVPLDGVASVRMPPTFEHAGIVNSGKRTWFGGETTNLEYHLDEGRITWRFEQGQFNRVGGHQANPVLLDLTLYPASASAADIARVDSTTIDIFYSPSGDRRFEDVQWLAPSGAAASDATAPVTRIAALEGPMAPDDEPRWLAIHTDPARRVRVDFLAWRKAYTREEIERLLPDIAASAAPTSALQAHFDAIPTFDERMKARHAAKLAELESQIAAGCDVKALVPGRSVFGKDCVVWLGESRRDLGVGRFLGRVPRSVARADQFGKLDFPLGTLEGLPAPSGGGSVDARPNLDIRIFHWADGKWVPAELQAMSSGDAPERETPDWAIVQSLERAPASARESVWLWSMQYYDVEFHPDKIDIPAFFARAAAYERALAEGRIVTGVQATKGELPK